MKTLCFLALFVFAVRGDKTAEEYIDIVIKKAIEQVPHPLHLPDFEGWAEYTEGVAWGLDELERVGPTNVIINENSHTFEGRLGVDEVAGRYKWRKHILRKIRSGFAFIKAANFTIDIRVRQDLEPEAHAELEYLKIVNMDDIDVEMTGLSYLSWIISGIVDPLANKFEEQLAGFVEKNLRAALENEFKHVRLPILEE
ncbi:uncharacterized protein LOC111627115 [Centruroides sculpturatus]|uniref:uncharacterized protein LOC111627115 n=1 Tax=Centruroides sculpturatus TaxID=218467 RepID=UPI000C6CD73A|nr:uncharacterized protein LOC111627115 [Centruroides sculpturatus]